MMMGSISFTVRSAKSFGLALSFCLLIAAQVSAQRVEHYNSPLYSPKAYEPGQTSNGLPPALQKAGIEQKLDSSLPLEAVFKDESGAEVKLGQYFGKGRPVVLALVYYECPMLCTEVLNGLTGSIKPLQNLSAGKDFDVVSLSFDARENDKPGLARNKKDAYEARYGRAGAETGMHFLTGTQDQIDLVTKAVGFNYFFDEETKQFAHAGGVIVITPEGRVSRYLYGVEYAPKDMQFALIESSQSKIGSKVDQLLLYCYHYDPATGTYGFRILAFLRVVSVLMVLGIIGMLVFFVRRESKSLKGGAQA